MNEDSTFTGDQMSAEKTVIKVEDVLVKFGRVVALDSFTADIPRGIIGFLGPNGAGKSTFIKTLLGLVRAEKGSISVFGMDPIESPVAIRDHIGYMPEDECLIQSMNAFELVSYMAKVSGLMEDDAVKRAHEVLDFVDVGEERYREIESYSSGMKQRVKLAQAIVHDPPLLFLDEPTTGMDPDGRKDMLDLVEEIGNSGKSVLVSSHVLHEVEQIGEYVVIIHEGRKLRSGYMDEIMKSEDGRYKVKIRGDPAAVGSYLEEVGEKGSVENIEEEGAQVSFYVSDLKDNRTLFESAAEHGVQVRYIRPDTLTLEDVFLGTFQEGGAGDGD